MMVSVSFCKPKKKSSVDIFLFFLLGFSATSASVLFACIYVYHITYFWHMFMLSLLLVLVFYLHAYMCTISIFGTCWCFLLQEQMQEVLDAMFEKKVIGFQF